jgi:hypothetical protein
LSFPDRAPTSTEEERVRREGVLLFAMSSSSLRALPLVVVLELEYTRVWVCEKA